MNLQTKSKQRVIDHGEVFTNPKEVNAMLDLVKDETYKITSRFLEPACGNGNFLVEILRRKLYTIKSKFRSNPTEYMNNIFLAIQSIHGIDILQDNVDETIDRMLQALDSAYKDTFGTYLDSKTLYAVYLMLSKNIICADALASNLEESFDVVITNPPYQQSDGGDQNGRYRNSAFPIYQHFINLAKSLNPRYIVMITPSRWFSGGRGLNKFREEMLNDNHIKEIHDFPDAFDCFPGTQIKGGVSYFLWDRDYKDDCFVVTHKKQGYKSSMLRPLLEPGSDVFIRYNESVSIYRKVNKRLSQPFSDIVSSQKPFGLRTFITGETEYFDGAVTLYTNKGKAFIGMDKITQHQEWINKYKIYISMAYGAGDTFPHQIINKPFLGEPNTCCTETYLVIGASNDKNYVKNILNYMTTKFFRFLVMLRKNTQHASRSVYSFVPMQDFSELWTDKKLYAKYELEEKEIAFIEDMIRPITTDSL